MYKHISSDQAAISRLNVKLIQLLFKAHNPSVDLMCALSFKELHASSTDLAIAVNRQHCS